MARRPPWWRPLARRRFDRRCAQAQRAWNELLSGMRARKHADMLAKMREVSARYDGELVVPIDHVADGGAGDEDPEGLEDRPEEI